MSLRSLLPKSLQPGRAAKKRQLDEQRAQRDKELPVTLVKELKALEKFPSNAHSCQGNDGNFNGYSFNLNGVKFDVYMDINLEKRQAKIGIKKPDETTIWFDYNQAEFKPEVRSKLNQKLVNACAGDSQKQAILAAAKLELAPRLDHRELIQVVSKYGGR